MYTFELIFAGLCLFAFQEDSAVTVHLVNAIESRPATCERAVTLPVHKPYLVFKDGMDGVTYPSEHGCQLESGSQVCPLQERDLNLKLEGNCDCGREECWEFDPVNDLRRPGQNLPFVSAEEKKDLGWLANLHHIDGTKIRGLRSEVDENILGNDLVISRVRIDRGKLTTTQLERALSGEILTFRPRPLRPPQSDPAKADHPKALSGSIGLELADLPSGCTVVLEDKHDADYKWKFGPMELGKIQVGIINRPEDDRLGPMVGDAPYAYHDRMRHFLWFYELVLWEEGCPDLLSAPLCPTPACLRFNLIPEWIRAGNHFCPPTTCC